MKGEKGDKGDTGDKGDKGDTGPQGQKGDLFAHEDFTAEQLATLKGPKGDTGIDGWTAVSIQSFSIPETGWSEDNTITPFTVKAEIAVPGMSADSTAQAIQVTPSATSLIDWVNAGVICAGQGADTLIFYCAKSPTVSLNGYAAITEARV